MLETIIVSAIVSFLTTRVCAKIFLGKIDRYVETVTNAMKDALGAVDTTPDKHV